MKQLIEVLAGRPGAGKTAFMLKNMVANPGKYLLACPRIDLIRERVADLHRHAEMQGLAPPVIEEAHSQTLGVETVSRQLADAHGRHSSTPHVVILTTHQALVETDFSSWAGWHARIDEVPHGVISRTWDLPVAAAAFERIYGLVPVQAHPGWSRIQPKEECPTLGAFMRDQFLSGAAELHKAVLSPQGALTTMENWGDLQGGGRKFDWASIWTPYELRGFESCQIASAGYRDSVTNIVTESIHPGKIELRQTVISSSCTAARVQIFYLTRHRGSTEFWDKSPLGRECIRKAGEYLSTQSVGYWAANKAVVPELAGRVPGQQASPKSEGTNSLRGYTSCAFIYSAKRQPADKLLQQLVPVLSDEQIERAREIEDIIQFVFRGAIRDAGFKGDYRVFLYDVFQAEALHAELQRMGIDAEIFGCEEARLMDVVRERPRREPIDERSQAERDAQNRSKAAARMRDRRASDKAARKSNGTYRGRGRPKSEGHAAQFSTLRTIHPP